MSNPLDHLRPADPDSVAESLSVALQFEGRRRVQHADSVMTMVAAERLVKHLVRAGFVVMRREGAAAPSTSGMPTAG